MCGREREGQRMMQAVLVGFPLLMYHVRLLIRLHIYTKLQGVSLFLSQNAKVRETHQPPA